jgi:hypothetical protein
MRLAYNGYDLPIQFVNNKKCFCATHMELRITETMTFNEIQEAFNEVYPFLSVDFYLPLKRSTDGKLDKIKPEWTVKRFCPFEGVRTINIDGAKSVEQVEADFLETLVLKAKVLRKSGNVWVGTKYTSNWTLENQNFEAQQIIID